MTVSQELAEWASGLTLDNLPDAVVRAASQHLLDGLGTAIAAARTRIAEPAVHVAAALGGPPDSTIIGTGLRVSAPAAALANGTLLHAADFDDTHAAGLVHPTAAVLPALFAVGEETRADGAAIIPAAVAGYEVVCRIAAACPHGFHARGIHPTQACGVFSAAVVASLLRGASPAVLTHAMGIAGSAAGGLLEFLNSGSSTKQLHPGMAALNGIIAARLADAGASGPATVLEGDKGLYAALCARPATPDTVVRDLGTTWETTAISVKPYPACQLLHAALDAVACVLGEIPAPELVQKAVVDVHPDSAAIVCEPRALKLNPRTPYEAKFSLPWSVAALLTDGTVTMASYSPDSVARPAVAELARRIEVRITDERGPAAEAAGSARIYLSDGRTLTGQVPCSTGTPRAPLPERALLAKFVANCGGAAAADELAAQVLDLSSAPSLGPILAMSRRVVQEQAQ